MRLKIKYKEKTTKNTNMWSPNNMLLNNNESLKNQIGSKKYLETNGNGSTMIQNLWDEGKSVLRGKFIVIQAYLREQQQHHQKTQYWMS